MSEVGIATTGATCRECGRKSAITIRTTPNSAACDACPYCGAKAFTVTVLMPGYTMTRRNFTPTRRGEAE